MEEYWNWSWYLWIMLSSDSCVKGDFFNVFLNWKMWLTGMLFFTVSCYSWDFSELFHPKCRSQTVLLPQTCINSYCFVLKYWTWCSWLIQLDMLWCLVLMFSLCIFIFWSGPARLKIPENLRSVVSKFCWFTLWQIDEFDVHISNPEITTSKVLTSCEIPVLPYMEICSQGRNPGLGPKKTKFMSKIVHWIKVQNTRQDTVDFIFVGRKFTPTNHISRFCGIFSRENISVYGICSSLH